MWALRQLIQKIGPNTSDNMNIAAKIALNIFQCYYLGYYYNATIYSLVFQFSFSSR